MIYLTVFFKKKLVFQWKLWNRPPKTRINIKKFSHTDLDYLLLQGKYVEYIFF